MLPRICTSCDLLFKLIAPTHAQFACPWQSRHNLVTASCLLIDSIVAYHNAIHWRPEWNSSENIARLQSYCIHLTFPVAYRSFVYPVYVRIFFLHGRRHLKPSCLRRRSTMCLLTSSAHSSALLMTDLKHYLRWVARLRWSLAAVLNRGLPECLPSATDPAITSLPCKREMVLRLTPSAWQQRLLSLNAASLLLHAFLLILYEASCLYQQCLLSDSAF